MTDKYKILKSGRIKALRPFSHIEKGEEGGYISSEDNLSQFGDAWVSGAARVSGDAKLNYSQFDRGHITDNLEVSKIGRIPTELLRSILKNSLGVLPTKSGDITLYKKVNSDLSSLHDESFKYSVGKIIKSKNFDPDPNISCGEGLHVSYPNYWPDGRVLLEVQINLKHILSILDGKVRVSQLKVLRIVK